MTQRMNLAGASILPFQFPLLDRSTPMDGAAIPVKANGAANGAHPPSEPETDLSIEADEAAAAAAIAAEASTRGYADGLERGFAEGRDKGYAAGFAEASAAAEARITDMAHRLSAIVERLGEPIPALDRRVEEAVAALALEVARCVIGGEVSRSREYLVRLIREAIAKVPVEMGTPRVVLNPADLELIRALAPEIEGASASLVGDESIEAGGCLVVADGEDAPVKDRRWKPRAGEGVSQVNLTLPSRWRAVMLALFDGEDG